jgi:ATP-dependent RNA helicase TDRD9
MTTICGDLFNALDLDSIEVKASAFNNYSFDPPIRKPLKIDEKKSEILDLLKKENAIVIRGFAGCGKTTQVPQFILDECYKNRTPNPLQYCCHTT